MPQICCEGMDCDFMFKIGDEITYSVDNKDYSIVNRLKYMMGDCRCVYQLLACDPTNPTQSLQILKQNESRMTKTDCLSVCTKLWPNLVFENASQFHSMVFNQVIGRICEPGSASTHTVSSKFENNIYTLSFNGVEFTKSA